MIYTRTERTAFMESGSVYLRATVAADGDEDRVHLRVLRYNQGSQTTDEIHLSPLLSGLHELLDAIDQLARENRGLEPE